jgi:mannitol-1-phosphate/altronate dehydrogenase
MAASQLDHDRSRPLRHRALGIGLDIAAYRAALMARFTKRSLVHRTGQIAMVGLPKLPQRLLAPLLVQLQHSAA